MNFVLTAECLGENGVCTLFHVSQKNKNENDKLDDVGRMRDKCANKN